MWHPLTRFRARVEERRAPTRRPRWYRPQCSPLEDRCLLSVNLTDSGPPVPYVGAPVVWTATSSGHGTTPVYQFQVGLAGGTSYVVQDFSTSDTFTWNPMQEGTYDVQVTVKDSYSSTTGESTSATYTATSRVVGTGAVISPMSNPLVALYSAPPSSGSSMYVQFAEQGPVLSWSSTAPLPIVPGESTNFIVAGMLPDTTYLMRDVLNNGTTSAPLTFTTGSLPTNVTFPTFTVSQAFPPGTDPAQNMILHAGLAGPAGTINTVATDLSGNIVWYYDSVANNFPNYATSLVPGGTVFLLGGNAAGAAGGYDTLRQIDLAGDTLRQTDIGAINAELAAMGQQPISDFDHDIQLLPNGDIAVIALTPRTINVNGTPTLYNGTKILVLDQNLQVTWAWDSFNWLNTSRLGTDGEGPNDWLHSNAISWSPEDGDLVLSMRAQDWVIKIDYANGTGDGHIVWTLGQGGNFTLVNTADPGDPSPWFSHQHDVRYINDTTLVVFDDGNTRHQTNPNADSRGQEYVLNETTMTATLVVDADLGNYSSALGAAQMLPDGNLTFTSGDQFSGSVNFGQSIEVLPNGAVAYVQTMSGAEYRSYFVSTLYGPLANLLNQDASTQGTWIGAYGAQGYDIVAGPVSLPAGDTVTPSGELPYTWTTNSGDPRALQVPGSSNRVAAVWYSKTSFSVDVDLGDGAQHDLELYLDDWDNLGRVETVQISDAGSGLVLSTQTISSFQSGEYLDYAVSGNIVITFTRIAGPNAILNGLLLNPSSTATLARQDTTTQGTWMGTYGVQGYDIVAGPVSLPAGDTVTPSGELPYTWTTTSSDPRALQVPGSSNRVAAVWYSKTSFSVDVDLGDGAQHDLELYLDDWDNLGRVETVQISDAGSGLVLSTQTISSFQSGVYLDYEVSGDIVITFTRIAGPNAILNGLLLDPSSTAAPARQDASTQGTWIGAYGAQGYDIVSGPSSLPAGDTITPTGQSTITWTTTSSDPQALQVPGSSNRVAAAWYSSTSFSVDVDLGDGLSHDLELYFDTWDSLGRAETVQISDAASGLVLSTQTISSFQSGLYLDYAVSGNIVITITRTGGPNAILNGLFLDPSSREMPTRQDATTQGTWTGTYGVQGYDIVAGPVSLPAGDTVTPSGELPYTWTTTSSDPRALQVPGSSNRVAAVWYSKTSFSVDVDLGDGAQHDLELYFDDWDNLGRAETVQISVPTTGAVYSTQTISSFQSGLYLDYEVSGNIVITITRTAGPNAILNGLFLDPSPTATFVRQDATTQGTWMGAYGVQGYDIIAGPVSLPAGDTVTPSGQTTYIATTTTSDPRALQVPGSSNRLVAIWYSTTSFSVDVNLGDGAQHHLELYFLDWRNLGRAETVQISDAASGVVLSRQSISSFQSGLYLDYEVSGNIVITITNTGGPNADLNGLFLDPSSTATLTRQDTTTQGTWTGTYGAQGYDIVAGPVSLPAGDTVTPSGQLNYTWTTTSSDPRALQVPGSSNRVAAAWYSTTSFSVDVDLGDGEQHDLELYFDDWDNLGRAETVQINDAASGLVLSTQTISSFQSGEYLDYAVSGHIVITITRTAGPNAVLNGLFLG